MLRALFCNLDTKCLHRQVNVELMTCADKIQILHLIIASVWPFILLNHCFKYGSRSDLQPVGLPQPGVIGKKYRNEARRVFFLRSEISHGTWETIRLDR